MKRQTRLILSALFVFASVTAQAKKTTEQYWEEVGLEASNIDVSNKTCNASEKAFIACIHGLNAGLAFEKDHPVLVPAARVKAEKGFGAVVKEFDAVTVIGAKKVVSEDFAEIYKEVRAEKKLSYDALVALYKNKGTEPVDFDKLYEYVQDGAVFKKKESAVVGAMQNAILGVIYDPHTYIIPKALMMEANTAGADNFTGVGAVIKILKKDGKETFVIQQPLEGGPAFKAGVKANDVITHVDGKEVEGISLEDLVGKIKGPKGTDVTLTLQRGSDSIDIKITRDLIEMKNVETKLVGAKKEAGYIKLSDFMKRDAAGKTLVYSESKAGLEKILKDSPKGIIFDLRDNGGGLLDESIRIASLFLKKGSLVVSTKRLDGSGVRSFKTVDAPLTDLPLVALINARSASASEIVSGAWQDHQRGFLIGERSFGKGTVQNVTQMLSTDKLLIARTIERFYQPSGRTNQVEGILPDIERFQNPSPTDADKAAMREEDEYAALPSVGTPWKQPRPAEIATLEACLAKGSAKSTYETEVKTASIPPDYQMLVAVDAINCISDEKIWSPDAATPEWVAPKSESPVTDFFQRLFQ